MTERILVIPTFNEAENLKVLIPRLFTHIPDISILVVDDASSDGTADLCRSLQDTYPRLHIENRNSKLGLGSAYRLGFQWSLDRGFEEIIEMDADLSHRVRDLSAMIHIKEENPGIDLIIGSRYVPGGGIENWPLQRELLSRLANLYVRLMLNMHVSDSTAGFRIYSAALLRKIDIHSVKSEGYSFQIEMTRAARRCGAEIQEVPIVFRERENGASKMSRRIVFESIWRVTIWGLLRLVGKK